MMVACTQDASGADPQAPRLAFPLACRIGETCEVQNYVDRDPGPGAKDYHCGAQTYDGHKGVDIRLLDMAAQARGVDVLVAAPGRVARLRDGMADVSIRAPNAPSITGRECGNAVVVEHGGGWETQYCHLARGSVRVKVGDTVTAGQLLARVGLSGSTEFPHLHLSVSHAGQTVDPFAPEAGPRNACKADGPMWAAGAAKVLGYKRGAVLNAGFAGGAVSMEAVEAGRIAPPNAASPALVAYARTIGLEAGDEVELTLTSPQGAVLATNRLPPLDRPKAQHLMFVGQKRPATGWSRGDYTSELRVHRAGKVVMTRRSSQRL
jgi:hypothetical protein